MRIDLYFKSKGNSYRGFFLRVVDYLRDRTPTSNTGDLRPNQPLALNYLVSKPTNTQTNVYTSVLVRLHRRLPNPRPII